MNKKRNATISHSSGHKKNSRSSYFSLDTKKKYNSKTISYSTKDDKSSFKDYYKSKNNQKPRNILMNSYNEINNYYLKCQNTIEDYFLNNNNQFGLKIDGNKNLENISLNQLNIYLNKTYRLRESDLTKKLLNYYYPRNNKNKLMGKSQVLTPIPFKKNIFMKDNIEKEDYLKEKRSAVCMRRLEYTYGLKNNKNKEIIKNKNDVISILKGAVKIIEDWWISILNKKKKKNINNELFQTINVSEKETITSIEDIFLQNLKNQKLKEHSNYCNDLIDNWISMQINDSINNMNNDSKNYINRNMLIFSDQNKKQKSNKTINKNKSNNITVFKNNRNIDESKKSNMRYNNCSKRNKRNTFSQKSLNSVQNPVKVFQKNNMYSYGGASKESTITPSDYLQNYFKNNQKTNISNNNYNSTNSKQNLETLELIQNKYKSINMNNEQEIIFSLNTSDNLLTQEEFENNKNGINIKQNTKHINNISKFVEPFERNDNNNINKIKYIEIKKAENNITNNSNQTKNITSDIEPIKQDEMINLDINYNKTNLESNTKKKKKNYQIKYNITKSQSLNKNISYEKSSMDGSVDEIISKKLKQFFSNDIKYSQRINKAYNQVKFSKIYGGDRNINFKSINIRNDNVSNFNSSEEY